MAKANQKSVHDITDRAKRYRANVDGVRPSGPRKCGFCRKRANVGVDHISGNESDGDPQNLMFLCKSCNGKKAALMKKAGLGVVTRQYNPKGSKRERMQEYGTAIKIMRGEFEGDIAKAVATIRATPRDLRSEFTSRSWSVRKGIYGPSGRAENPMKEKTVRVVGKVAKVTKRKLVLKPKAKNAGAFKKCVKAVSKRKGVKSPAGVCAAAGRKKYGAKVFAAMGLAKRKNPGAIATLSYGANFAEITQKGPDQYLAEVKQKGKAIAKHVWKSLRDAMDWARDKVFSQSKNPMDSAEKMFEVFHGYPSKEVLEYVEKEHRHSVLAGLGTLTEMHVLNLNGDRQAVLKAPDPETANFADVIQVAVSEDGKQLYLVGGDQKIPLKTLEADFGMTPADVRDKMLIGTITRLTYRTVKSFEAKGEKEVDFYHDLGKEHAKGVCPVMEYKPRNPSIEIVGGRYYIAPGDRRLKGVSPGIVG